ncbi:MAG: hypothetical protein HOE19_04760 [Candidatus Komeilibacteria bacterium]|mgnify:FL=1|jgi:hypothetical protein|nr:hypothetical protein [Candidatus Komeilibacteria bacterium]MBT4447980.1 hypothetical protein [Candidatus Komeilibacteria bacterium]
MRINSYQLKLKWLYLLSIFSVGLGIPIGASAGIEGFVRLIAQTIWSFFVTPMMWLLRLELDLLKIVASYNNFTSEGGVVIGWIALRDLSNMFFILILLVIAFATILRLSSYGYQQLLKRTIIIAILINFSKSIVGFLIDVVQVVMLTFIAAINNVMAGGIVVALGLQDLFAISSGGDNGPPLADYVIGLIMSVIFILILIVIMGVMVMMLTMRIVALWVVIVLSPLAFISNIFPYTKSFYSKWSKELGANLVTGPMLAFFMWLTFTIVGNGTVSTTFMAGEGTAGPTEFLGTSNMVNYIVAIALLLAGIKQAAASGAAGANMASKGMSMIQNSASKFARRYPMALGKRLAAGAARGLIDDKGKAKSLQQGFKNLAKSRLGQRLQRTAVAGKLTTAGTWVGTKTKDSRLGQSTVGGWVGKGGAALGKKAIGAQWNKVPFYGGRLQRAAMKAQGQHAAMVEEFQAEDEKYISPKHRGEFEASQGAASGGPSLASTASGIGKAGKAIAGLGQEIAGTKAGQKIAGTKAGQKIAGAGKAVSGAGKWVAGTKVGRATAATGQFVAEVTPDAVRKVADIGLGDAYSKASSLGGDKDRRIMASKIKVDREEVSSAQEAAEIEELLESVNDQPRLDKLRKQWGNAYTKDEDVDRAFNESDARQIFGPQKAEAAWDEIEDVPMDGAVKLIEGALRDVDSLGLDIGKALLAKDKSGRINWTKVLEFVAKAKMDAMPDLEKATAGGDLVNGTTNEDTGISEMGFNNKGAVELDSQHELVKLTDALMQAYPQQAAEVKEHLEALLNAGVSEGTYNFDDDSVNHIRQGATESNENFEGRKISTKEKWDDNNDRFNAVRTAWGKANGIEGEEDWTAEKRAEFQGTSQFKNASQELYSGRRILMGAANNEDKKKLDAILAEATTSHDEGVTSDEDYERIQQAHQQAISESSLMNWDEMSDGELIETAVGMKAPEREIVQKVEVTEADVKARREEDLSAYSKEDFQARADTDGISLSKAKDVMRQETEDKARQDLDDEAIQTQKKAQGVKNDEFVAATEKYDEKKKDGTLSGDVSRALDGVRNSADGKRLVEVNAKISDLQGLNAGAGPQDQAAQEKIAKLMFEQNKLMRKQSHAKKAAIGLDAEAIDSKNHFSRAILKGSTDGMDYSRLQEMNLKNPADKHLFDQLARVATQDQQRQLLQEANPDQIKSFAETLVKTGQKLNKMITDNLTPTVKREVFTEAYVIRVLREGGTKKAAERKAAGWNLKQLGDEVK